MNHYKTLESFINFKNSGKIDKFIKKASKLDCNTLETETYMHKSLHKIKDNMFPNEIKDNIDIFQTIVKVKDIFKYTHNSKDENYYNEYFKNLDCGTYKYIENDYYWDLEYLVPNISNSMIDEKIIFIILDFEDYGLDCNNNYEAHSTVLLFIPNKNKKEYFNYNCYYINSHGINSLDDKFYEYKLSSKRKIKKKLEMPFDFLFVKMLVNYLNHYDSYKIKYNNENNYLGVNFQASDSRGICFVYPIVIFYYFGKYFLSERNFQTKWGNINIKCGKELIENGYLNLFIESMFIDFCPEYKLNLLQEIKTPTLDYRDNLINIIENKKLLYCKIILRALIKFLSQIN